MLALAVALSVPVALLIALALGSVAAEEAAQHQTLASRAFDEMERALSRFLEAEEARPIAHYAYFLDSSESAPPLRSPLSRLSDRPFVIGHFQIDPTGALYTPLRPRRGKQDANERPDPRTREAIAKLERLVPAALLSARARQGEKKANLRPKDFGATIALEEPARPAARLIARLEKLLESDSPEAPRSFEASASDDDLSQGFKLAAARVDKSAPEAVNPQAKKVNSLSLDEALDSLNVGQKMRERRNKRYSRERIYDDEAEETRELAMAEVGVRQERQAEPSKVRARAKSSLGVRASQQAARAPAERDAQREVGRRESRKGVLAAGAARHEGEGLLLDSRGVFEPEAPAPFAALDVLAAAAPSAAQATTTRIEIDPMVGHVAGHHYLLLSRTVLVGEHGYRQGLLIDRPKLGQWLRQRVISDSRLADVSTLRFGDEAREYRRGSLDRSSYLYRHHFAEPFDSLNATLALSPLAGGASARNIYALSALLAVVAAGGLFAVYRMIAVRVRFADRRSAFVSAVSHELKTPLTAIRMYGEMLRDGLVLSEDKRQEYYCTIHDESERLGRLINNVLEFSQLERGQRELNLIAGSIEEVVQEVVSNLAPHAERQGFTLSAEVDDDLPAVRFDRDALVQVLFNLADNAMKYARGAGPQRIRIGCYRADERGKRSPEGQRVVLEVRDFGPGVPRRHLSHLFEPFYRASASDEVVKGTGIGLALVRDLCDAMGAAVSASNVEAGGFRVLVDFRAAES